MSKKLGLALPTGFLECVQQSQAGFFWLFYSNLLNFLRRHFYFLQSVTGRRTREAGTIR